MLSRLAEQSAQPHDLVAVESQLLDGGAANGCPPNHDE
jgi:hypothetical protein